MATENFEIKITFPKCASCAVKIGRRISTLSGISKVVVRPPPVRAWVQQVTSLVAGLGLTLKVGKEAAVRLFGREQQP